ncbi:MAG: META domain-containing protein [Dysgonamonadaceae bacterium]|jgi:heat shock protein HslJ|nr:META domain-containing protein [Dysgonamonadaceae bacterium]
MKRTFFYVMTTVMTCSLYSCKSSQQEYQKPDTGMISPKVTNYRETAQWTGIYYGVVPCADCPGIDVELTLNSDLTYSMKRIYKDREGVFNNSGKFTWNKTGTQIDLKDVKEYGAFEHFLVQDEKLILLSITGDIMADVNMDDYTLTKNKAIPLSDGLTDKYWKLVEIMGRPVTSSEAHIQFKTNGTVNGSLGCNTFNGNYTRPQDLRIRFSNLTNTLKMCVDISIENDLKQVLQQTDSYYLNGDQLILNRARMAPLARFEAIYK